MTEIPYYDSLMGEEQREITESVRLLLRQTFILERKYDRRTGRFQYNREFRICNKHLEFIRAYFSISGISVHENSQIGVIYIQGETLMGDKLPRLATLYLLILKLIYDEQMESVSTSIHVYTTLGEMHEKLGSYLLFKKQPSLTDMKRAVTLLKKYQVIEPLELLEDLKGDSRLIVYPCINVVLLGEDLRTLLESFTEENSGGEAELKLEQDSELETEPDEPDRNMDRESEAVTEPESDLYMDQDPERETESESDRNMDRDPERETKPDEPGRRMGREVEQETEPESDRKTDWETEPISGQMELELYIKDTDTGAAGEEET